MLFTHFAAPYFSSSSSAAFATEASTLERSIGARCIGKDQGSDTCNQLTNDNRENHIGVYTSGKSKMITKYECCRYCKCNV